MKKTGQVFLMVFLLLFSHLGLAAVLPDLSQYFLNKIDQVQNAVCTEVNAATGSDQAVQDIDLDLLPTVSFGISSVLSLSVSPEIDFVFTPDTN